MIAGFLAAASLLVVDPSGDAHGAGDLVPPTAEVYSSVSPFDLVEVEVLEGPTLALRVRLGDRPNPGDLANGVTLPVIDLYLDTEPGGREELLPGPGLRMPADDGWEVAIRVTGDAAYARRANDPSATDHPVTVTAEEDALRIATPFEAPEEARVQAITGVYDPFDPEGWRPLTREASPWAFSSETAASPVVDLLAEDDPAQRAALRGGVLPVPRSRVPAAPWLVLMVLGVAIAVAGVVLRGLAANGPDAAPAAGDGRSPEDADAPRHAVLTDAELAEGNDEDAADAAPAEDLSGDRERPSAADGPVPPLLAAEDLFDPEPSAEAQDGDDAPLRDDASDDDAPEAIAADETDEPSAAGGEETTETPPAEDLRGDAERRSDAGRTEGPGRP